MKRAALAAIVISLIVGANLPRRAIALQPVADRAAVTIPFELATRSA